MKGRSARNHRALRAMSLYKRVIACSYGPVIPTCGAHRGAYVDIDRDIQISGSVPTCVPLQSMARHLKVRDALGSARCSLVVLLISWSIDQNDDLVSRSVDPLTSMQKSHDCKH